ncbi:MAG: dihydroneopterin aldolase [Succinivibrio dextrinosolvens]|uniref:7,8-dihydroneopterin aldolase n=1 Tax=Succinivibrio dextrinosolvens TaxID=83771 RepID=A0A662ZBB7_9GAMM|nr:MULTISPECIES: dihydroneopterin aldolase [Succinivibrio]MBQ9221949.1 dihydroneopterin aldolase [Succinivibrio sp.]MDY6420109.1 dihydroneopterin aldolase [Succinivibrio dextrinosolvens]MDY6466218.1 dihydroneopterin aldolase [Succinivibrio dextrinosolvens]MDY6471294.1 dihydroneopterin aldolase [Succinivibrio dextrinosolvens]SFK11818.1 dihydroneopterin aldolase [Succinivibrio dextrinosolvens]
MDKIFITDLRVECIIGILDFERVTLQPLLVSIEIEKDLKRAGQTGDLAKSIDYADLSLRVKKYIINRKAKLLEELGVELCDIILKEYAPYSVTVRLNKPEAVADVREVGIQITKTLE